ncbi:MAG: phage portal protein [Alphaproteobacteria bacterium]
MGIKAKIANWLDPAREERAISSRDPSLAPLMGGYAGFHGQLVTHHTAQQLSTVLACVQTISSAVASLPAFVYRRDGSGRVAVTDHPVAEMITSGPNVHQTWPDFAEWLVASTLLRGNGLVEVVADRRGRVSELRSVPWDWTAVNLLPNDRLTYDVSQYTSIYGGTGRTRRLLQSEVLHLRDRTDDGLIGRSRLQRAGMVFSAALSTQEFAGQMYANGINPSGVLELEGKLDQEGRQALARNFRDAMSGADKAGKALILDQGLKWKQMSINPEDAELLAARRFTTEELARIFQVPPPLVGIWDHSSFTNSETAGRWFAQHTLQPWIRKIETAFHRSVFTEDERGTYEIEIDLSGFMRGDYAARWQAHKIAIEAGILTTDEVREIEGWSPAQQQLDSGGEDG